MTVPYSIDGSTAAEIAANVERAIEQGQLEPEQQLPPIRRLADRLEISPTTVASAYGTLRDRGLVHTDGRRGTRVALPRRTHTHLFTPLPEGTVNLADGNPDPDLLPPLGPLMADLDASPVLYGDQPNLSDVLEIGAAWFASDEIPTEALAVVGGARDGIERVLQAHLRPGDRVAVEDPGFTGILELLDALGLQIEPVLVDDAGMSPSHLQRALAAGVRAVVVIPRAHNPTGAALDDQRASELRTLLDEHDDVLVVEDDHAGPVAGAPAHSLYSPLRQRWATIRSVSKFLGPDLRLALLAGDPDTIARVEHRQLVGTGWVSRLLQQIVARLLDDPATQQLVAEAEATYTVRRRALVQALSEREIPAHGRSGTNVWVPVPEEVAVIEGLARAGWTVAPGEHFRTICPPGIRVTTSSLQPSDAERFAADLADLLRRRQRTPTA